MGRLMWLLLAVILVAAVLTICWWVGSGIWFHWFGIAPTGSPPLVRVLALAAGLVIGWRLWPHWDRYWRGQGR